MALHSEIFLIKNELGFKNGTEFDASKKKLSLQTDIIWGLHIPIICYTGLNL